MTVYQCEKCGEPKGAEGFYWGKRKSGKPYRLHGCRACRCAPNPERSRRAWEKWERQRSLTRKYGIGQDDYDELLHSQEGLCAICRRPERIKARNGELRRLAVDHDHETGKVRGLLCSDCNTGLGKFQDDSTLLQTAIAYLLKGD